MLARGEEVAAPPPEPSQPGQPTGTQEGIAMRRGARRLAASVLVIAVIAGGLLARSSRAVAQQAIPPSIKIGGIFQPATPPPDAGGGYSKGVLDHLRDM